MGKMSQNYVTLRQTVLTRLGLLVTGTALVLGLGYALFGIRPLVEQTAESQFNVSAAHVESAMSAMFAPAQRLLAMSKSWIGGRAPDLDVPDAFNRQFRPILETVPQFTSVVAGTSAGQGWLLLQLPDGQWRNRMTDIPRWGNRHLLVEYLADGQSRSHWESMDYDARLRPWFEGTQGKDGKVAWTSPYSFFTTGDPGITASTRWRLDDGRDFVLGFDLMLRDLSTTSMEVQVGRHGLAMVLTEDLRVLALPAPPVDADRQAWLQKTLQPATGLDIPQLNDALAQWRQGAAFRKEVIRFRSGGKDWLGSARPYQLGQQRLWVVVLAPEADFFPTWEPLVAVLLSGMLLVLAVAMLIGRAQVRRFAQPLEALASQSTRIGQLDFQAHSTVNSPITEIQQLATAQDAMRGMLQRYRATVDGQATGLRQQIAALREAEARIRESEAYNKVLFADSRIPLVVLDPQSGTFVDCNQAAVRIYHLQTREEVLGLSPIDVSAPTQYDGRASEVASREYIQQTLQTGSQIFEWRHRRPDGQEWDAEIHLMAFKHGDQTLLQFSMEDITERKQAEEKLERLAFFDPLTLLPNRALFVDRLNQALIAAQRHGRQLAVMFMDLDRFKEINDTQGHAVGDMVLVEVAHRFQSVLRQEESLARVGGDEFIVLASGVDQGAAVHIAERLQLALAVPLEVKEQHYSLRVSIGIALYPGDGETADELFKHADVAMYRAKAYGSGFRFYEPEMSAGMADRMALARDLHQALQGVSGELELHYQPQVKLASGRMVGAEALLRWRHPSQGMISPGVFIPIAEERGMMRELGEWVFRESCRQMVRWRGEGLAFTGRLAINIAAQQMEDKGFAALVQALVEEAGLKPALFELELTESGLMRNVGQALGLMGALKVMGFALAIDDFGTGYSSLAYLKQLPADKIKIDMSFVRDMLEDRNDHAIVATIIGMGRNLRLKTIAEGVESTAQVEVLLALGCDEAQGYYFGRPVAADEFARTWLRPTDESGNVS